MPSSFISTNATNDIGRIAANCEENNKLLLLDYRNKQVAGFRVNSRIMICLPQAYQIFLSDVIGGMHTVYTKLKRLCIQPIICNVEQVRLLRSVGAIQTGVNRCKLIQPGEFDKLYDDCTDMNARPGRPAKRVSPILRDNCKPVKRPQLSLDQSFGHNFWAAHAAIARQNTDQIPVSSNQTSLPSQSIYSRQWFNFPQTSSLPHQQYENHVPSLQCVKRGTNSKPVCRNDTQYSNSFRVENLINHAEENSQHQDQLDLKLQEILSEISTLSKSVNSVDDRIQRMIETYIGNIKESCDQQNYLIRKLSSRINRTAYKHHYSNGPINCRYVNRFRLL